MNRTAKINQLWDEFGNFLSLAYEAKKVSADESNALRDYACNVGFHDGLEDLLRRC